MTAPVVAAALLFWVCVFMVYFTASSTTPSEFFLGRYEAPPDDLGVWKVTPGSSRPESGVEPRPGWVREERCLLPDGRRGAAYLLRQVRYRDAVTRQIVRVEPEQRVARRRVSVRS